MDGPACGNVTRGGLSSEAVDRPRLEHVRVNVSDFSRAVAWYESILELTAEGYWPPESPKYAHFETGAAQFALSEVDPVPAAGRFNFSVRDVEAWWEKLRARAEISKGSMVSLWMVGIEDQPERCGEICVMEVFGDAIFEALYVPCKRRGIDPEYVVRG